MKRLRTIGMAAAVVACLVSPPRAAAEPEPPPARPDAPPLGTRVRVAVVPGSIPPVFSYPDPGALFRPPNPSGSVDLRPQAASAYRAAAARAFAAVVRAGDVELEVRVALVGADLSWDADGWRAVVAHDVSVFAGAEREVGRWHVDGEWPLVGLGERTVPRAFQRAAEIAAGRWASELATSEPLVAWLGEHGLPPPPPRAPPEVRPRSSALIAPGATPAALVAYVDAGLAGDRIRDAALRDAPDGTRAGLTLRAGASGRHAMAELLLARWSGVDGSEVALGADLGAVLRVRNAIELRGGAGISGTSSAIAPTAFAGVHFTGIRLAGTMRARFGVEVRTWIGTGKPEDPPRDAAAVVFGVERPLGSRSAADE